MPLIRLVIAIVLLRWLLNDVTVAEQPNIVYIMADDKWYSMTGRNGELPKNAVLSPYFDGVGIVSGQRNSRELQWIPGD